MAHEANNASIAGEFVASLTIEQIPIAVQADAIRCLVDWSGVTTAGWASPLVSSLSAYAGIGGGKNAADKPFPCTDSSRPEATALTYAAAAHALDFDDTYIPADTHFSAVAWAVCNALASPTTSSAEYLRAFVAGYEVGAKLAGRRMGFALQFRWFHPTAVLGRFAAAASAASMLRLSASEAANALALVATTASGLRSSLGSDAKPLQVGEAARDGVRAAFMARQGLRAPSDLLSPDGGFARAFVQDGTAVLANLNEVALGDDWAVRRTSFKPYACLHGIHPSVDAARALANGIVGRSVRQVRVYVAPGVKKVARFESPNTPLEAKFSVHACVAMGLCNYALAAADFTMSKIRRHAIQTLMSKLTVVPEDGRKMLDSAVEIDLVSGERLRHEVDVARGHPGNPMTDAELDRKFMALTEQHYGNAANLLRTIRSLPEQRDLTGLFAAFWRATSHSLNET